MVKVSDVLGVMEQIAPAYMKMDWDNVGLLCGDAGQTVHRVLVALDPFENVVQEAIESGADLLVTHHPLIFVPPKSVTTETSVGRSILLLAKHGISAVNAHTNLDCAPGGVNDCLAAVLGLEQVQVVEPAGTDAQGQPYGLLRCGIVEDQPLEQFLEHVKAVLCCDGLRYVTAGNPFTRSLWAAEPAQAS